MIDSFMQPYADVIERLRVRTDASERYGRNFVEYLLADDARAILDHIAALTAEKNAARKEAAMNHNLHMNAICELVDMKAECDAAMAEVVQIVAWLWNNMPITIADLNYEANAIAARA
jgi:hypothetical protein